ncbi:BRO-N domain-containing protein [Roseinatronobacter sp.]|uniref:BRO-N domain-containing protein n=1 Tax=Roseinatronobacter sp. TaxID=1945755 RepID=UPI0025EC1748|nr:BRO family protein [Roseibaca sp.]
MANLPTPFQFHANTIRVLKIDGEPWFVAADVCSVFGYTNTPRKLGADIACVRLPAFHVQRHISEADIPLKATANHSSQSGVAGFL